MFSATVAVAPLVITGVASFTFVTVAVTVRETVTVPSLTSTPTTYVLFASASLGASKFGAATNVNTPVDVLMLNKESSMPPPIEYVKVEPASTSVAAAV